jgi:hypothetical protein
MTTKQQIITPMCFVFFLAGVVIGAGTVSVVGKIYINNLHHVACKMYNTVKEPSLFQYVNTQFRCNNEK